MLKQIFFLIFFVIGLLNPEIIKSIQNEDSLKINHENLSGKFAIDTNHVRAIVPGNNLISQTPSAEIGPYIKHEEKKVNRLIYIICSVVILVIAVALYFFRNTSKDKKYLNTKK